MKRLTIKWTMLLTAVVLMLMVAAGSTVAYLITSTPSVENTFTPPTNGTEIEEVLSSGEKKDVKVKNTADYPVYVRAKVTIWWEADAEHPAISVQNSDYTASYGNDWDEENDGFYYYSGKVAAGSETSNLINSIKPVAEKPGYKFHVDIAAQTIQAEGMGTNVASAQDAFKAAADSGTSEE